MEILGLISNQLMETYPNWVFIPALFFAFCIGHALGDFPLQGSFLAKTKDPNNKEYKEVDSHFGWLFSLLSHCLIHAGIVWIITSSIIFAFLELVLHFAIDYCKPRCKISYSKDQCLHYLTKVFYCVCFLFLTA